MAVATASTAPKRARAPRWSRKTPARYARKAATMRSRYAQDQVVDPRSWSGGRRDDPGHASETAVQRSRRQAAPAPQTQSPLPGRGRWRLSRRRRLGRRRIRLLALVLLVALVALPLRSRRSAEVLVLPVEGDPLNRVLRQRPVLGRVLRESGNHEELPDRRGERPAHDPDPVDGGHGDLRVRIADPDHSGGIR